MSQIHKLAELQIKYWQYRTGKEAAKHRNFERDLSKKN